MTAPITISSTQAEGSPPAAPVQPADDAVAHSHPSRECAAANSQGFDESRSYFPVARRPRATRPPADALSMREAVAAICARGAL